MRLKIDNRNKGISTFKHEPKTDDRKIIYVKEIPTKIQPKTRYFIDAENLND
jgi:hypothetical protein